MRTLELMGILGCHLCDVAASVLVSNIDPEKYEVYQVDIADDDQLMEQYAPSIPVLVDVNSQKALNWPFDAPQLQVFLDALPEQGS